MKGGFFRPGVCYDQPDGIPLIEKSRDHYPSLGGLPGTFAHIPWEDTPNFHKPPRQRDSNSFINWMVERPGVSSRDMWVRSLNRAQIEWVSGIMKLPMWDGFPLNTLPKTKIGVPKRKVIFQPPIFRCYVSFREGSALFGLVNSWPLLLLDFTELMVAVERSNVISPLNYYHLPGLVLGNCPMNSVFFNHC